MILKKKVVTKPYQPAPYEQKMLADMRARLTEKPPAPRVTVKGRKLAPDHPNEAIGYLRLCEAVGTHDTDFLLGLLSQLCNAASQGREPDEHAINFMFSVIKDLEPRDQVEAMLAAQMAAVHNATMTFARRLGDVMASSGIRFERQEACLCMVEGPRPGLILPETPKRAIDATRWRRDHDAC